jgi:K+-transporting ATPase c subunit
MKKINWTIVQGTITVLVAIGIITYSAMSLDKHIKLQNAERQKVACPSLLSIGRSSRDTLIIMKVEPLCNEYVLNNLK